MHEQNSRTQGQVQRNAAALELGTTGVVQSESVSQTLSGLIQIDVGH